jgi:hypothetical protein
MKGLERSGPFLLAGERRTAKGKQHKISLFFPDPLAVSRQCLFCFAAQAK